MRYGSVYDETPKLRHIETSAEMNVVRDRTISGIHNEDNREGEREKIVLQNQNQDQDHDLGWDQN